MAEIKKYLDTVALGTLVDQIKAEDAKAVQAAKDYADGLSKNYDAAGTAATEAGKVKTELQGVIDGLVDVYDEKGAAAAVDAKLTTEVGRATGEEARIEGLANAAQGKADANEAAIAAINNETTGILAQAKADATEKANAVQAEVDALEEYVGTIPATATATNIVAYVQEKTAGIATSDNLEELAGRVTDAEAAIDAIEADYLKAADKTELEGKITSAHDAANAAQKAIDDFEDAYAVDKKALEDAIALKADQTALDAVSGVANAAVKQADYDVKVKALEDEDTRIAGLVTAEEDRAKEAEKALDERLVEVETFFKTAEGESLDEALDTLVELQAYLDGEGKVADQMILDIAANKKAIEDHAATDHDFAAADATLKSELVAEINKKADSTVVEGINGRLTTAEGKVSTLESEMDAAEGRLDAVEGAVATKVETSVYEAKVGALESADDAIKGRLDALEAKTGEGDGSIAEEIEAAKNAAIEAAVAQAAEDSSNKDAVVLSESQKYTDAAIGEVEAAIDALEDVVDAKAAASDLTALDGRVATVEGKVSTLETEMDAVEAKAAANETAIGEINTELAKKAAQTDLDAAVGRIAVNEGAISALNDAVAEKADQDDLDAATDRIKANEDAIAANTSAINSFVAITSDEVNALFA